MNPGWSERIDDTCDNATLREVVDEAGTVRIRGHYRGPRQRLVSGAMHLGKPTGSWSFFDHDGRTIADMASAIG